jgi:hypothetical protein
MAGSYQITMHVSEPEPPLSTTPIRVDHQHVSETVLPLSTVTIRVDHRHDLKAGTPFKGQVVTVSDILIIIMPG